MYSFNQKQKPIRSKNGDWHCCFLNETVKTLTILISPPCLRKTEINISFLQKLNLHLFIQNLYVLVALFLTMCFWLSVFEMSSFSHKTEIS